MTQDGRVVTLHRGSIDVICNLTDAEIHRPAGAVLLASPGVRVDGDLVIPTESFAIVR
ncbi:hypothetical protein ACFQ1S_30785 [Kibdelosporangium lantanae]|uniref:Uncharacterized protein n=1 Tax=Kibdelosporangium lantanae TaxID=1497396 RepID=A0ABW3MGX7_9PSEU